MRHFLATDNMHKFGRGSGLMYRILQFSIYTFLISAVITSFATYGAVQHIELAKSFIHGHVDFMRLPENLSDVGLYKGRYYWHLPPLHVILLVPFVAVLGEGLNGFYGPILHIVTNYAVFATAYFLAAKILGETKKPHAMLLAFGFCFSTVMHLNFQVAWLYYTLHSLCVLFLLLAVYGRLDNKSPRLIGVLISLAFLSRYNALLTVPFFISPYLNSIKKVIQFSAPIVVVLILVGFYNKARFGNFIDLGYMYTNNFTTPEKYLYELKDKGMFKLSNIPTNFYYYFLKGVDPVREDVTSFFGQTHFLKPPFIGVNYPGTSFFVVSPIMLVIFMFRPKTKDDWLLIANTLVMVVFLLTYYWSGWVQIGPRYMSDVLPFLYLMLLYVIRAGGVKKYMSILIFVSAYFNMFLLGVSQK